MGSRDENAGDGLRIGQLATTVGINPKTIRYYEELGLLSPVVRTRAGYRCYTAVGCDQLRFIIKAKATGLTLGEIGELLAVRRGGEEPCAQLRATLDRKLAAVEAQLHALAAFRDELRALRAAAASDTYDGEVCGIIERHTPQRQDAR